MSRTVEELLNSFDRLPEAEQREAASEILRRIRGLSIDPISDEEIICCGRASGAADAER